LRLGDAGSHLQALWNVPVNGKQGAYRLVMVATRRASTNRETYFASLDFIDSAPACRPMLQCSIRDSVAGCCPSDERIGPGLPTHF
jgi:hypothetical protein